MELCEFFSGDDEQVPSLVKTLIPENKRTRDKFLDFRSCGLTKVPTEIGELAWIEYLNLGGNGRLTDLAPLVGLSALQSLDISRTRVSDLAPLAGLSALRRLNVSNTQVSELAPLSGLSALQRLYVSNTQVSDLAPVVGLSGLMSLDVRGTQVSDLAPACLPCRGFMSRTHR